MDYSLSGSSVLGSSPSNIIGVGCHFLLQYIQYIYIYLYMTSKILQIPFQTICCGGGCCLVTELCLTLCNPMDCSPPGSSVHWVSQARILEWVAISFSRGSSQSKSWTHVSSTGRQVLYHWAIREAHYNKASIAIKRVTHIFFFFFGFPVHVRVTLREWLGLWAFTAVAHVQSLDKELSSHKPGAQPKKGTVFTIYYNLLSVW